MDDAFLPRRREAKQGRGEALRVPPGSTVGWCKPQSAWAFHHLRTARAGAVTIHGIGHAWARWGYRKGLNLGVRRNCLPLSSHYRRRLTRGKRRSAALCRPRLHCNHNAHVTSVPSPIRTLRPRGAWQTGYMTTSFTEPAASPALLLLGKRRDPLSERGVDCPGELPLASDPTLVERARKAKEALGDRVFVLGHHYQRDEVIQFADVTGDSFKLARDAAGRPEAEFIVFCGVHFMAESADILTSDEQQVILPDMAAGCSMADMANINQVEDAWAQLVEIGVAERTVPTTYMNSTAAIKAFCGRNGGAVCTSSNAEVALNWAYDEKGGVNSDAKVFFLPDQHLGRNTAVLKLGLSLEDCVVWDPRKPLGGNTVEQLHTARIILWKGHCSVHGRFRKENVDALRADVPGINILVHPECTHDVVNAADYVGSTEYIINTLAAAEPGSAWGIGTELNLVRRLANAHPDKAVHFLEDTVCFCSTMNRIDLPHLVWALESLVAGEVPNRIVVDELTQQQARVALDRMLSLPAVNPAKD